MMNRLKNHFLFDRRRRIVLAPWLLLAVFLSAACGKKGPLYLPDEAKKTSAPATASPPK